MWYILGNTSPMGFVNECDFNCLLATESKLLNKTILCKIKIILFFFRSLKLLSVFRLLHLYPRRIWLFSFSFCDNMHAKYLDLIRRGVKWGRVLPLTRFGTGSYLLGTMWAFIQKLYYKRLSITRTSP